MSLVVLIYHKLIESDALAATDPLKMTVSAQTFREQLAALASHFTLIDLPGALAAPARFAGSTGRFVCVTFDDGYWPSLQLASSILSAHAVPASCFVSPGHIDDGLPYWWDVLVAHRAKCPDQQVGPGALAAAARELKRVSYKTAWNSIENEIGAEAMRGLVDCESQRPASWEQLRGLGSSKGITFGLHGHFHDPFRALEVVTVRENLLLAKSRAAMEGVPLLNALAYPFGDADSVDPSILRDSLETEFSWGFMAEPGVAFAGSDYDRFSMPRVHVTQGNVDKLILRLRALFESA